MKEDNGIGLGLAVMKKIVDMHNSDIDVRSELLKGKNENIYSVKGLEFLVLFNFLRQF